MKIIFEADLSKGNGIIRWEGVTVRRVRHLVKSLVAVLILSALVSMRY
jgi:hypothetical protein